MAAKLMEGKVCPNHPERQAVSRCTTCIKPLCQECVIVKGDLDFCSDQCATNHFTTNASIEAAALRDAATKRKARIRRMVLLLVLLLVVFGFVFYWQTSNPKDRETLLDKAKKAGKGMVDKTKEAGEKAVDKTKKLVE